jgi:hypothetical protein
MDALGRSVPDDNAGKALRQRSVKHDPPTDIAVHHLGLCAAPMIFRGSHEPRAGSLLPTGSSPSA